MYCELCTALHCSTEATGIFIIDALGSTIAHNKPYTAGDNCRGHTYALNSIVSYRGEPQVLLCCCYGNVTFNHFTADSG